LVLAYGKVGHIVTATPMQVVTGIGACGQHKAKAVVLPAE
jgi:hypothetical protein